MAASNPAVTWARELAPWIKVLILISLAAAWIAVLAIRGPIIRGPYTYQFPDARTIWGIPYFFNVITNIPFVVVGALGLSQLRSNPAPLRPALAVLFIGIFLTGFGSSYHHLSPGNDRLIFDRLPMTIAFAGVFSVALGDRIRERFALTWLFPLVAIAAGSAFYWYFSTQLRPYVFVQGYPMVAIPAMLLLYRGRWTDGRHFMAAVALYGVAKLFELYDSELFELGNLLSGHSFKHLFAGWATWHLVLMAKNRARSHDLAD